MRVLAYQSTRGGVGKTKLALRQAKYSAITHGKKVCLLDFDFIGEGLLPHLHASFLEKLQQPPHKNGTDFFLASNPYQFDIDSVLVKYHQFHLFLPRTQVTTQVESAIGRFTYPYRCWEEMMSLIANERLYHEIQSKTVILLDKLQKSGFEVAIFDCHTGNNFVSESIRSLVDELIFVSPGRNYVTVNGKTNFKS